MDQIHREPPRLRAFVPGAPPHLDDLLQAALAKDPTHRFQDAGEMRAAFAAVLDPHR